jgi:WD40 repeat protein
MIKVEKNNILAGHKDCIYTLIENHDQTSIFSADGMGMVAQWHLKNPEIGELVAKVPNSIYAMTLVPHSTDLIVAQNFEGLHWIDYQEKKEKKSIKITNQYIFDVKINKNNIWVACGDGVMIIVDLLNWAVKKHIKIAEKSLRCIVFHPTLPICAIGNSDFSIHFFDTNDFLPLHHIQNAHKNSVFSLAFSPCGRYLLSGSRDAHLKVWNVENFSLHKDIVAHLYAINHIVYSPDNQYFATCSMDKSIKVWDAQSFKLLKVIDKSRHAGHATSINKLVWTSFENYLISGSDDRFLAVWRLEF